MDLELLAVTIGVFIVMGSVLGVTLPHIQKANKAVQESVGAMGAELERILGAFRTVKDSGAEPREADTLEGAARELLIAQAYGDAAGWLLDGDAMAIGHPQQALPTVAEINGRPARTFAEWVADNAEEFR